LPKKQRQTQNPDTEHLRRRVLPVSFYARPAELVAASLLGQVLVKESVEGVCAGRIVETEAYLACGDEGCHAARGMTPRNSVMWEAPGTAYVYVIHTHCCLNAVTGALNFPEAVLIRALEPLLGIELMQQRRKRQRLEDLTSGPGKLTQALGIGRDDDRSRLDWPPVYIAADEAHQGRPVTAATRIGLAEGRGDDLMLRYYHSDSKGVLVKTTNDEKGETQSCN